MLFLMRHGERADNLEPTHITYEKYEKVEDPHLTSKGKEQAAAAANKILQMVQQKKLENVRVVSSPFVRCLMTAEQVALKLKASHIEVDDHLSEMLCTNFYKNNPMGTLHSRNHEQLKKYIQLPVKHIQRKPLAYPQNNERYAERANTFFDEYQKSLGKDQAVVLVSHGYSILFVLEPRGEFDFEKGAEYCCMCAWQGDKLVLKQHHELL